MEFNDHKIKHIDKESFELVDLLEVFTLKPDPKPTDDTTRKKLQNKPPVLTITLPDYYKMTQGNLIRDCHKTTCIGFNEENQIRFEKLVMAIHKPQEIRETISYEFIEKIVWDWLIKTKRNGKADMNLSSELKGKLEESILEYKVYFIMLYFHPRFQFTIGAAEFGSFSNEFFDSYIERFAANMPNEKNSFIGMKKMYAGTKYVSCSVKAEKRMAETIALAYCSVAVDILKICSNTLDLPFNKLSYDIDCRTNVSPQNEIIVEAINSPNGLTTNLRRPPYNYVLDEAQMSLIEKRNLKTFDTFFTNLKSEKSELEVLIVQGIQRFADCLSHNNLHQRIASLFTILESLLLVEEDSPISENVSKYASRLLTKDVDVRKDIIKLIKGMYKIRSKWVHHAIESEVAENDLRMLQKIVHSLLIVLINRTRNHKVKLTILNEIDEAILGAG